MIGNKNSFLEKFIKAALYNQKVIHEKFKKRKGRFGYDRRRTATPWLIQQTLVFI